MPKIIDESKLNYNKYPGEHVLASGEVVQIGTRTFHLVRNYREAFDTEKLEQRFSDVLDKYDYIVGDWGFEQLRLKGFFSVSRKKMQADNKIDHLEDYINEYCNYGCAYFVLRRVRTRDVKREEAFTSEKLFTESEMKQKLDKPRRKRSRNRNRKPNREEEGTKVFQIHEKSADKPVRKEKQKPKGQQTAQNFKVNERSEHKAKAENKPKNQAGQGFVIRTRGKEN